MGNWFRKKASKYKAVPVFKYGRKWPSKLELAVYEMLLLMERGGAVKEVRCQVHVRFKTEDHGKIHMIPDFSAVDTKTEELFYIEAKGFPTQSWKRKKKAWAVGGPAKLLVYGGAWQRPLLIETVIPKTMGEA